MARMKGKDALFEMLRAEAVRYIFGNPGTAEAPIMDTLRSYRDIEYILAVQEGVAVGMADGFARATGRPSFLSLHIHVGMLNGLSLLFDSFSGNTPVVATAGNSDVRKLVEGRSDLAEFPKQITKWSAEVTHADQMAAAVRRAFQEARTPPRGPTFLSLSANALDGEGEADIRPSADYFYATAPEPGAVDAAVRLLSSAQHPVMIVGDRVGQSGGMHDAVRVAELTGSAVYTGFYSEVCFPTSHPQYVGSFSLRNPAAKAALSSADVVVVAGFKAFGDFFYHGQSALPVTTRLIHIDNDIREIGRTERTEVGILSDPKLALAALAAALEAGGAKGNGTRGAPERRRVLAGQSKAREEAFLEGVRKSGEKRPMLPARMMAELAGAMPPETVLVDDSISSKAAVMGAFKFDTPGSMYAQRGGAIGWGMGGALGVKLAQPDRPVIAVLGDGSAMMTVQGLWTAANYQIPVVYMICNNASYRILKVNMRVYHQMVLDRTPDLTGLVGMDFGKPFDFARIASAFDIAGERVADPAKLGPAIRKAVDSGRPAVIDVEIDGSV
ncbi:MAG: thiamine pyrophosphate-binding protein [Chloroflexi bacterium]|nr:thiamine pyrophosphate-binding protein [Chloroflexota bacterium]